MGQVRRWKLINDRLVFPRSWTLVYTYLLIFYSHTGDSQVSPTSGDISTPGENPVWSYCLLKRFLFIYFPRFLKSSQTTWFFFFIGNHIMRWVKEWFLPRPSDQWDCLIFHVNFPKNFLNPPKYSTREHFFFLSPVNIENSFTKTTNIIVKGVSVLW